MAERKQQPSQNQPQKDTRPNKVSDAELQRLQQERQEQYGSSPTPPGAED